MSKRQNWFEHVPIGPVGKKGMGKSELSQIQNVAVNAKYFEGIPEMHYMQSVRPVLQRFTGLDNFCKNIQFLNTLSSQHLRSMACFDV